MTIKEPLALLLIALAILPFMRHGPRAIFNFSSFMVLPKNSLSSPLIWIFKLLSAMIIISLSLAIADIYLNNITSNIIDEGSQIVFIRDLSGSMFLESIGPDKNINKANLAAKLITDFVKLRPHNQYGLIDFGSPTITRSGLTFDSSLFLKILNVPPINLMGTLIDSPIVRAIGLFPYEKSIDSRAIILLSDGGGRLDNLDNIVRWLKELNINFWWVFIGSESDWKYANVQKLVDQLGLQAKKFRSDNPADLEEIMSKIRNLQHGVIRRPVKLDEYSLKPLFYKIALLGFSMLGFFTFAEMLVKPGVKR